MSLSAESFLRCRSPLDIRVYRRTRVLPCGKTSLLLNTSGIRAASETELCKKLNDSAFARGKTLDLAEGSRQKALETARILKQLGDSTQKIIQATGLSQAEVEAIK